MTDTRPLILSCPLPRSLPLIFSVERLAEVRRRYRLVETTDEALPGLPDAVLAEARYIIGQPPLDLRLLERLASLRCIFNVESNLLANMPYDEVFRRGIHVVTTGAVFAQPVAEIGLGFALSLLRNIHGADADFRAGRELWGGDGNGAARLLSGADVGIIGFGDLGRAVAGVLAGFKPRLRVYDPWLPASRLHDAGAQGCSLTEVLAGSDVVFCTAAVTSENRGFLGPEAFASMRRGALFLLLSRADVVDFAALMAAVASGHILAATDVFPQEPLSATHPVRSIPGFLLSAHRAGALDSAFRRMGEMVLEDLALLDRDLPPMVCKRAERETVARFRSKPVTRN